MSFLDGQPCSGQRTSRREKRWPCFPLGDGGSTAVEFALVSPILIFLIMCIFSYGGYFLLAHTIQQLANEAARAAVAGVNDSERRSLAAGCLGSELPSYGYLNPASAQLSLTDLAAVLTVQVSYDATTSPVWSLRALVPMPSPIIIRTAAVQLGGY